MRKMSDRKRIVVKVGTSTLTHHKTGRLNIRRVEQLVKTLADVYNAGHEVILVSSGAIGLGMGKLGLIEKPKDTPGKQACAAVGQCELMNLYDRSADAFDKIYFIGRQEKKCRKCAGTLACSGCSPDC